LRSFNFPTGLNFFFSQKQCCFDDGGSAHSFRPILSLGGEGRNLKAAKLQQQQQQRRRQQQQIYTKKSENL
jgi:hypothetical protein